MSRSALVLLALVSTVSCGPIESKIKRYSVDSFCTFKLNYGFNVQRDTLHCVDNSNFAVLFHEKENGIGEMLLYDYPKCADEASGVDVVELFCKFENMNERDPSECTEHQGYSAEWQKTADKGTNGVRIDINCSSCCNKNGK